MLKLRKVAVTGGLSCGKSSVCRIFKELGAYVVSADTIVHQLLSSDKNLAQEIVNLLGSSILVDQKLDRSCIARKIFQDVELLKALENLVHPIVYSEIEKDYQEKQNGFQHPSLFIAEIPLLFESCGERDYDDIIVVGADSQLCCERFEQTTQYDQIEFYKRTAHQFSLLEKMVLADYVILNNGTLSDLQQIARELYHKLTEG